MSASNRMPITTAWQAAQQIPNKYATIRQSETSLRQVYHIKRSLSITKQRPDLAENFRKIQKFVPVKSPLRDCNTILQQSYMPVGLPAGKNGKNQSSTFWANWTRWTSTNWKQFWLSGSPQLSQQYVATGHTSAFIIHIFVEIDMLTFPYLLQWCPDRLPSI